MICKVKNVMKIYNCSIFQIASSKYLYMVICLYGYIFVAQLLVVMYNLLMVGRMHSSLIIK